MNGVELFRLGRRLMKMGVAAMPPSYFSELPTSVRLVLLDVFEHPGCAIGQIVERTGFPQSHVSAAVARLRELGVVVTDVDPSDRRRTLVAPAPDHVAEIIQAQSELEPVDDHLAVLLSATSGTDNAPDIAEVTAALDVLARALICPNQPRT